MDQGWLACRTFSKEPKDAVHGQSAKRGLFGKSGDVGGKAQLLAGHDGGEVYTKVYRGWADRVLAGTEEGSYAEALLHPAKEELDLPALALEIGDGGCRQ